jgi:TonB family protein
VLNFVEPVYPESARAAGAEGQVTLQLDVDAEGKLTGALVVNGSGRDDLDASALDAAKRLEFAPATRADGRPAKARMLYRFSFSLKERPADATNGGEGTPPDAATQPPAKLEQALRGVVLGVGDAAPRGRSTSASSDDLPVAKALVRLVPKTGGEPRTLVTGDDGSFAFDGLDVGEYTVSIEATGYRPVRLEEKLEEGEVTQVKYRVVVASDALEVLVQGERPPREVVKRTVTKREIDRIPGTNGDAIRSLQNLPGVARPPSIAGILLVRGSGPQDTQTFIDGTVVPIIYHFGGLSSVVPTEVLERIDFYPGNFGAEYGRVTGGIVDVGLRSPKDDGYHGLVQADLIDARGLVEGPVPLLDNWTFLLAGRRSYLDAWLGPVLQGAGAGVTQAPVYYDYQALLEHKSASTGRFRIGFFGSDDALELLLKQPGGNEPALTGRVGLSTAFQRLQLLYEHDLTPRDHVRASIGGGEDSLAFGLGPLYFNLDVFNISTRAEYAHTFSEKVRLNAGMDVFTGFADIALRIPEQNTRPGEPPNQPFSTRPLRQIESSSNYCFPALYSELELQPAPGVRIVPGLRLDYTSINKSFDWSPRVSGRFDVTEGFPRTTLKGGVGLYHQPPQFQQVVEPVGTPGVLSNRSIHYALGVEQEMTRQLEGSVEGFVKQLDNFVIGNTGPAGGLVYDNRGLGYVAGGEFLLRYKPDERFFGWVAYTLSRSVRQTAPGEPEVLVNFDQTHILTMLGSYQLGHGWELGARFRLVSGNLVDPNVCNPSSPTCDPTRTNAIFHAPSGVYVPIPLGNNTERLPMFHALDLRLDKRWKFTGWQLAAYLDVQNAYNNQNTEALNYNFNFTQRQYVSGLPILPSLGLRADF